MSCDKHGYTNGTFCPACDLEDLGRIEQKTPTPRLVPDRPSDAATKLRTLILSHANNSARLAQASMTGTFSSNYMRGLREEISEERAAIEKLIYSLDAAPPAEAPANLDAAIIREASEVLEAVGASGVELPANWRWPLADELYGMSLLAEAPAERGDNLREVIGYIADDWIANGGETLQGAALRLRAALLAAAPAAPTINREEIDSRLIEPAAPAEGDKPLLCIHPDTLAMVQSDARAKRVSVERWGEIRQLEGYVPLYTAPA